MCFADYIVNVIFTYICGVYYTTHSKHNISFRYNRAVHRRKLPTVVRQSAFRKIEENLKFILWLLHWTVNMSSEHKCFLHRMLCLVYKIHFITFSHKYCCWYSRESHNLFCKTYNKLYIWTITIMRIFSFCTNIWQNFVMHQFQKYFLWLAVIHKRHTVYETKLIFSLNSTHILYSATVLRYIIIENKWTTSMHQCTCPFYINHVLLYMQLS